MFVCVYRRRFLTTPQVVGDRPAIISAPDYKVRTSLQYDSQAQQHSRTAAFKAEPYKEQLLNAFNADRRRIPLDLRNDGSQLRTYWKDMIASIREPVDEKMYDLG